MTRLYIILGIPFSFRATNTGLFAFKPEQTAHHLSEADETNVADIYDQFMFMS